jgi:hypothetical protein
MKRMINGEEYEIPTNADGSIDSDVVRKAAGIPPDRPLLLQRSDGSNRVINPGEHITVRPEEHMTDAPAHTRGA